ncbi:unnamed protein product [Cercospora beticola]|nr:unnamed protein product [Cercospora beticola]
MAFGPPPAWGGFVPGNGRPVRGFWDGDDIPASPIPRGPAGFPGMGGPPPQHMFSPRPMPVPMPGGGARRGLRDMFNGLRAGRGVLGRPPRPDLRKPRRNGDPPGAKFDPSRFVRPEEVEKPKARGRPQGGLNLGLQPQNFQEALHPGQLPRGGFKVIKALKRGGQSEVVNLVQASNGQLFVEKRIRRRGREELAERELRTLATVSKGYGPAKHLNTMVGHTAHGDAISLILEYCDGGSVDDLLDKAIKAKRPISEVIIWNILYGAAAGLAFLHDGIKTITPGTEHPKTPNWNTICHLDIKPQNLFISRTGGIAGLPRVIVGDFGCAVSLKEIQNGQEQEREQPCGTPAWYPPEGKGKISYGTKTDIWALGLTIFCLCRLTYNPSMRGHSRENLCGRAYSREMNALVRLLTASDLSKRPPARDVASAALKILKEKVQK